MWQVVVLPLDAMRLQPDHRQKSKQNKPDCSYYSATFDFLPALHSTLNKLFQMVLLKDCLVNLFKILKILS